MNGSSIFIDTNILLYAHDLDEEFKWEKANQCLTDLWDRRKQFAVSVQVIQELYVNLIRKNQKPEDAFYIVESYLELEVVKLDTDLFKQGVEEQRRWKISFWDGLILAAARKATVDYLWSEDFNPGQDYDGIVAWNPLLDT
jgi:predicted nucleic acid-binding protein